ncbi:uncharacterized protein [Pyrus communis]|uniref:uncharacterized protein n=1 Tax=Pyrus communis TaxID=23211 RepID=UPI0035C1BCBD
MNFSGETMRGLQLLKQKKVEEAPQTDTQGVDRGANRKLDLKEEGEDDGKPDEVQKLDSIEKVEEDEAGEWQNVDLKTEDEAGKLQKVDLKAEEDGAGELQKVDLKADEGGEGVEEEEKSSGEQYGQDKEETLLDKIIE